MSDFAKSRRETTGPNTTILQITGIVFMAAGWGWTSGNFVPQDSPLWVYITHALPFVVLAVLCLGFFRTFAVAWPGLSTDRLERQSITAIHIFAACSMLVLPIGFLLSIIDPNPTDYGIRTVGDWVAIIILVIGCLFWLTTLLPSRTHE